MTIIDFYKQLSWILERTREHLLSIEEGKEKLQNLLDKAEEYDLHVNVSLNILNDSNLGRLDDEKSFTTSYEDNSYDDLSDSSY